MRTIILALVTLAFAVLAHGTHAAPLRAQSKSETAAEASNAAKQPVVNLNTASAAQLEQLPGVGPKRAEAILALRTSLKRFSRLEQLLLVRGIGRATFRKLRPWLTLDDRER